MSEKQETHTPGPWVVKHDEKGLPFIGVESDPLTYNGTIASVDTSEKDARLIASAPELLEMCKLFEDCMANLDGASEPFDTSYELSKVRAVLAKVEGETT